MAGPVEILIVLFAFGLVGVFLTFVHRFLKSSEAETKASGGTKPH